MSDFRWEIADQSSIADLRLISNLPSEI